MVRLSRPVVPQRVAVPRVVRIPTVLDAAEALVGKGRLLENSLLELLYVVPVDLVLGFCIRLLQVFVLAA